MSLSKCFLFVLLLLASCESDLIPYALEQGLKQGAIVLRAEDISKVLKRPNLDPKTRQLLTLSQEIILYANKELGMKTGQSYRKYVDLKRNYLTQVVMAAHKDRLESFLFTFPVVGAVPYKGYFDESDAIKMQNKLESQDLDTYRRDVDAFSSLGWFRDPLVSTMLVTEAQITELLFHELVHLNFYFEGESDFNEAFATYYSQLAAEEFMKARPELFKDIAKAQKELELSRKQDIILGGKIREALDKGKSFYMQKPLPDRKIFFDWLTDHFSKPEEISKLSKLKWNNATLLSLSTYYELIPKISKYAEKNRMNYRNFLKEIIRQDVHIVPKVLAVSLAEDS